jgi:hypothetical protein
MKKRMLVLTLISALFLATAYLPQVPNAFGSHDNNGESITFSGSFNVKCGDPGDDGDFF